jgi:hypothetical protein
VVLLILQMWFQGILLCLNHWHYLVIKAIQSSWFDFHPFQPCPWYCLENIKMAFVWYSTCNFRKTCSLKKLRPSFSVIEET